MAHMVKDMAYRGETPWHGLGVTIPANATIEDILQLAGMTHNIERRLVRMRISRDSEESVVIPGYMAIVRDSDSHVFQVASDRYHPWQYRDIVELFRDFIDAGEMELETCGLLKDGAIAWAMAKFTSDYHFGGDKSKETLQPRALIYTSHDGSLVTGCKMVVTRVVCWNTLSSARSEDTKEVKIRHTRKDKITAIKEARKTLGLFRQEVETLQEHVEILTNSYVDTNQQLVEYVARLTNPDLLDKIVTIQQNVADGDIIGAIIAETEVRTPKVTEDMLSRAGRAILEDIMHSPGSDLPTARGTWWGALNGVTHYVDHLAGTRVSTNDQRANAREDNRLTSAWFGPGETLKSTALELALQYAEGTIN